MKGNETVMYQELIFRSIKMHQEVVNLHQVRKVLFPEIKFKMENEC